MTVCREVEQGVEWPKVRAAVDQALVDLGEQLELGIDEAHPDPETWGLSPAQQRAQQRLMDVRTDGR